MVRIAMRSVGVLGVFAAVVALMQGPAAHAQATPIIEEPGYVPTLVFDVVSLRPADMTSPDVHTSVQSLPHASRFEAKYFPIKALIQIAYGFDTPIADAPDWIGNTLYDIQARSDADTDARLAKLTANEVRLEKRHAVQVMLADRLGLKTHLESRMSSLFLLTVAKGGVKMKELPAAAPPADGSAPPPPPSADTQAHGSAKGLEFVGSNDPMRAICGVLNYEVQAPVIDKTGLMGLYNYTLQVGGPWSMNNPDSYPSVFTAVQEQMGLKLEAVKQNVPNLVIDKITKPTEN
ncbi:MAG: TIGR03435 family protein [Acidobacteriota bacterium]